MFFGLAGRFPKVKKLYSNSNDSNFIYNSGTGEFTYRVSRDCGGFSLPVGLALRNHSVGDGKYFEINIESLFGKIYSGSGWIDNGGNFCTGERGYMKTRVGENKGYIPIRSRRKDKARIENAMHLILKSDDFRKELCKLISSGGIKVEQFDPQVWDYFRTLVGKPRGK